MKVDELRTTVDQQEDVIEALKATVKRLTDTLEKSEAIHRGELRGRLVKRIVEDTILTPEDIIGMTEADMQDILEKVPLMRSRKGFVPVTDAGGSSLNARPSSKLENVFAFGPDEKYKDRN